MTFRLKLFAFLAHARTVTVSIRDFTAGNFGAANAIHFLSNQELWGGEQTDNGPKSNISLLLLIPKLFDIKDQAEPRGAAGGFFHSPQKQVGWRNGNKYLYDKGLHGSLDWGGPKLCQAFKFASGFKVRRKASYG